MNNRQRLIDKQMKQQYKREYRSFKFKIPRKKKKQFLKNYKKFMDNSPYVKPKKYYDTDIDMVQKKVAGGFVIMPRHTGKKESLKLFMNGIYGRKNLYGRLK